MKYSEVVVGGVFLLGSLFFWYLSLNLKIQAAQYPQILLILLGILSAAVIIKGFIKPGSVSTPSEWKKVIVTVFLVSAFVSSFKYFDFLITTPMFILIFLLVLGDQWPVWKKAFFALSGTLLLYFIFGSVFQVPLP